MLIGAAFFAGAIVVVYLTNPGEHDRIEARAEKMRHIDYSREHYFGLKDGHTFSMKIVPSFEPNILIAEDGNYFSPKSCILGEVYRQIRGATISEVQDILQNSRTAVVEETYRCVEWKDKVAIRNLRIEYRDFVDLGTEFSLPELPPEPPKPKSFRE